MVTGRRAQVRWPAYTLAALLLGHALGKTVSATQHRAGIPGGPVVSASEYARYAGAVILVLDGFVGLGLGWQRYHGVAGIVVLGLLTATTRSCLRTTRRARA